jgi:hypothetical protein
MAEDPATHNPLVHVDDRREHRASRQRRRTPPCGRRSNPGINGSTRAHSSSGTNRNDKRSTTRKIIAQTRAITT